jgi:hypothetical protein
MNMVDQIVSPARVLFLTGSDNFSSAATPPPSAQRGQNRFTHFLFVPRLWSPQIHWVWGFHNGVTDESHLLGRDAPSLRKWSPTLRRNMCLHLQESKGPWRMKLLIGIKSWNIVFNPIRIHSVTLIHRQNFYLRRNHKIKVQRGLKILK